MFLQLHDGPGMSSARYPRVPDLRLPDVAKISNRQILYQAIEEGGEYAANQLQKAQSRQNAEEELPTLSLENLEELEELLYEDEGMSAKWWVDVGLFIVRNFKKITDFLKNFAKTVQLFRVNNRIQDYYDINQYSFQELNEMTPRQIDGQLKLISGDLLNATAEKRELDAITLSRMSQVYQQRKAMLPIIDQRTMLILGGGLLAYLFFKNK